MGKPKLLTNNRK